MTKSDEIYETVMLGAMVFAASGLLYAELPTLGYFVLGMALGRPIWK
jgi:hypothetical protein